VVYTKDDKNLGISNDTPRNTNDIVQHNFKNISSAWNAITVLSVVIFYFMFNNLKEEGGI